MLSDVVNALKGLTIPLFRTSDFELRTSNFGLCKVSHECCKSNPMNVIKTLLADDQCVFVEGLKTVLSARQFPRFDIVGVTSSGEALLHLIRRQSADLLILDLNLSGRDGVEVLKCIHSEKLSIRTLVFSRYDDPRIVKSAFHAGVDGYILKDKPIEELFTAACEVLGGHSFVGEGVVLHDPNPRRPNSRSAALPFVLEDSFVRKHHLTKRELEILRLIAEALSNKEIARELFISDQTVSVHRKNIMRKLGVSNTAALIRTAFQNSLV